MQAQVRTTVALAIASLAILAATGAQAQNKAEVLHWWTSGGESAAVKELASAFTSAGGVWVDSAVALGENARAAALNRIVGGNPPTAAMFNTSQQYLDVVKEGMLNNIDAVATKEHWDTMLPTPIVNSIRVGGHYYAAPVNIHMPSWFWYSKPAFAKAGITAEPKTADELFAALDKLKTAGLVPLALGGQSWQEYITFYSWMAQVGGTDMYLKFFKDHDTAVVATPAFRKILADFKRLKGYTDAASPGRNWNDATAMLITGKAGVQIMGDWAKGEFANAKQTVGKDFGCFPGFGPKSPYIIAGDVFVFPRTKDPAAIKTQLLLAESMTSATTQVAFNIKKGSIPIRTDVDSSKMDQCAQTGLAIMKDKSRQLANPDMLMAPDMTGAVTDIISKFWNTDQSVDAVVKELQNALKG